MRREAERFRVVDEIFRAALRASAGSRSALLSELCRGDVELRAQVEALLAEDARSRGALDEPMLGADAIRLSRLGAMVEGVPEPVPERIGRYRIISRIGSGGMGTVYEAEQENPRRKVAVKVISQGVASPGTLRRFEYEAQLLGRLQHPGIARIYEAGVHDSGQGPRPYLAMELIGGRPLIEYAAERGLGTRRRLELIAAVADAVHHAHQRGVIHRDLKPANILVDESGQPRILDFGVARAIDADVQATTARTDAGQLVGTVAYMSPEQAGGDPNELDTRSDVYALGVVAYELLAGRMPYEVRGRSVHEAVRIIQQDEPTPISVVDRVLRGDVQTILGKALEKDKSRRYDSASALAEDVRRYLADEPIAARPPSAAYHLRKFARRHRAFVGAALLVMAGLAGAAVFSAVQASRAEAARRVADAEAARAVKRFNDVRALSKVLIFDVHDAIEDLPGATPAREKIVGEGLKYLEALTADAGADRDLLHETIQGYTRIAEILGNPGAPSLGRYPEARAAYERGLELVEHLPPADAEFEAGADAYAASRLHSGLANLLMYEGRGEEALRHARAASAVVRPMKDARQSLAGALAIALSREVQILAWMGRPREALEVFREVYAIDESLLTSAPEEHRGIARRNFAGDNIRLGDMHRQFEEYEEAIGYYRRALAMAEEMLAAGDARARRTRNVARLGLGKSLRLSGDAAGALAELEEVRRDTLALAGEDPENVRPLQDLIVALQDLGDAEASLGHHERALRLFREQFDLAQGLMERSPGNVNNSVAAAMACERAGDVLIKLGRMDEGLREYGRALERVAELRERDASIGVAHEMAVVVNRKLGERWLELAEGHDPEAGERAGSHLRAALDALAVMEARSIAARHDLVDRHAIEALLERAAGAGSSR